MSQQCIYLYNKQRVRKEIDRNTHDSCQLESIGKTVWESQTQISGAPSNEEHYNILDI